MALHFFIQAQRQAEQDRLHAQAIEMAKLDSELRQQQEAARLRSARSEQDISHVANQKELYNAFRDLAGPGSLAPGEAEYIAQKKLDQSIASGPEAATSANQANEALGQESLRQTKGRLPLAPIVGRAQAQNTIEGLDAKTAEAINQGNVARERRDTAPLLGSALDKQGIQQANFTAAKTEAMQPSAAQLGDTEAQTGITGNQAQTAQNVYNKTEFPKLDPGLAAQAKNAELAHTVNQAGSNMGEILPLSKIDPMSPLSRMFRPGTPAYNKLQQLLTEELSRPRTNIPQVNQAPAVTTPSTIQKRPLNINDLQ